MKKMYNICDKKNNNVILSLIFYDKKVLELLLPKLKKSKQVNVFEVYKCEEKI